MKTALRAWLHHAISTSPSTRIVEACRETLDGKLDNRYAITKVWGELVIAATTLEPYAHVSGKTLLLPPKTAEVWRDRPDILLNIMDVDTGITVIKIERPGCAAQVAVMATPKDLKRLKELLGTKARRRTILFGFSTKELIAAIDQL